MGVLSNYALNIENNIYRAAAVLMRKSHRASFSFSIVGANDSADEFTVEQDRRYNIRVGETYNVEGSTGNDGEYTVATVSFDGTNTIIGVEEDITDPTADGIFLLTAPKSDFVNVGQIKNASVDWEPNLAEADTAGRQKELSVDFEVTLTMQQTSDTELAELEEITKGLMDVVFSGKPHSAGMSQVHVEGDNLQENSVVIREVLIQHSGMLNFSGDESTIDITIPFRVRRSDLPTQLTDGNEINR